MQKGGKAKKLRPEQSQPKPGLESRMHPRPVEEKDHKPGSGKLEGRVAVITGGDSGIGKAVALLFAKEGADICILYLNEHSDAEEVKKLAESYGQKCVCIAGDIRKEKFCREAIAKVKKKFGKIDILVNNAAVHWESKSFEDITTKHLQKTFETNVFSMFYLTQAALPLMNEGGSIINTTSVTAYRGSPSLIDYSSSKGAIVSFTRSLSAHLNERKIRVNAVAPGPIWTPLIASSFKPDKVSKHGSDVPMKRAGQPAEVAPCYLLLASDDGSYISGQVLHPNGGEIVNG